jgi:hypothetical protein
LHACIRDADMAHESFDRQNTSTYVERYKRK